MSAELTEAERVTQLAHAIYATGALNLPLSDRIDEDCHDAARAVIGSGWVSPEEAKAREAAARREALLEAATEFEEDAADAWGGNAPWMTTGVRVANLAAEWLRESAAALAEPERDKEGR
jgi:hypothetical protein